MARRSWSARKPAIWFLQVRVKNAYFPNGAIDVKIRLAINQNLVWGVIVKKYLVPLAAIFVSLLFIRFAQADAIISGHVCVIDGNTLQIGGKAREGKCWGGIDVFLFGSAAPRLEDTCTDKSGNTWACGKAARNFLANLIKQRNISCFHIDGEFEQNMPVVTCISGRKDLSLALILDGLAKASDQQTDRYSLEQAAARKAGRGIWK